GAYRRCGVGGEHAQARLDQILGESRRVIGAAARTGHDAARRKQPQALAEPLHSHRDGNVLPTHGLRGLASLDVHPTRHLYRIHDDTLSSATKSYVSPRK